MEELSPEWFESELDLESMTAEEVNTRLRDLTTERPQADFPLTREDIAWYTESFEQTDPLGSKAAVALPVAEQLSQIIGEPVTGQVYSVLDRRGFQRVEMVFGTEVSELTSYDVTGENYEEISIFPEPERKVDARMSYENPFSYHAWNKEGKLNHFLAAPSSSNKAYPEDLNDIISDGKKRF